MSMATKVDHITGRVWQGWYKAQLYPRDEMVQNEVEALVPVVREQRGERRLSVGTPTEMQRA